MDKEKRKKEKGKETSQWIREKGQSGRKDING